jgi:hypothetical protein
MVGFSAGLTRRRLLTAVVLVVALGAVIMVSSASSATRRLHPGEPAAAHRPAAADRHVALRASHQCSVHENEAGPKAGSQAKVPLAESNLAGVGMFAPMLTHTQWVPRVAAFGSGCDARSCRCAQSVR